MSLGEFVGLAFSFVLKSELFIDIALYCTLSEQEPFADFCTLKDSVPSEVSYESPILIIRTAQNRTDLFKSQQPFHSPPF